MKIHVEYFAQARDAAGRSRESVDIGGERTLLELATALARSHGLAMARLLFDGTGQLSRQVLFTVDDVHVIAAETVRLADGNRVTIVPPISGG